MVLTTICLLFTSFVFGEIVVVVSHQFNINDFFSSFNVSHRLIQGIPPRNFPRFDQHEFS